jgi:hypothetical protein
MFDCVGSVTCGGGFVNHFFLNNFFVRLQTSRLLSVTVTTDPKLQNPLLPRGEGGRGMRGPSSYHI